MNNSNIPVIEVPYPTINLIIGRHESGEMSVYACDGPVDVTFVDVKDDSLDSCLTYTSHPRLIYFDLDQATDFRKVLTRVVRPS